MSSSDKLFFVLLLTLVISVCHGCGNIDGPQFPWVASPLVTVSTPSSPASGDIPIIYKLIDRELEQGTITLEYSTDGGQTYNTATLTVPGEATNLASGWHPGKTHAVQWDSVTDMVGRSGAVEVKVRITPSDASNPSGTAGVSDTFTVDNTAYNEAPTATTAAPAGVQSGNVQINYFLSDVESDTCSIEVLYSVNNGTTWQSATMGTAGDGLTGLSSSPAGTAHVYFWDSRADNVALSGQVDTVKIRVIPTDFNTGTAGDTNSFSVDNSVANNPPTVTIETGPADSSTVTTTQVTFTWSGSDTDGSVIGYYYSFDHDPPDMWTTNTTATSLPLTEGLHIFRVVAMDNDSDLSTVASRTFTVSIPGTITADFIGTPLTGEAPLTVDFTDLSTATNGIDTWSWDFGNGDTSTEQHPSCIYDDAGSYTVSLTVTGPDGEDTETKTTYITVVGEHTEGTIYVDDSGGLDSNNGLSWVTAVKTIQTGLDKASDNWTVFVANGTYTGTTNKNLDFAGKAIHLKSVGGASNCVIDCENDGRGFYFHSGETNAAIVEGLTVKNGGLVDGYGAGILCKDSSSPIIRDCAIENCHAVSMSWVIEGGGISCMYDSSPSLIRCTIAGNSAGHWGGGLCCLDNCSPAVTDCTIAGNSAQWGGGISCDNQSNPVISDCTVEDNSADDWGGGILCRRTSELSIANCTIRNNWAGNYGGGIFADYFNATILCCIITGNRADSMGGGIYCDASDFALVNCVIAGNSSVDGGCIHFENSDNPTITNCTLAGNTADWYGGGISAYNSYPILGNCILWANTATNDGNEIFTLASGMTITLNYCDYADNTLNSHNISGFGDVLEQGICIHLDPQFLNAAAQDYHLQAGSPCIDAGDNSLVPSGVTTDFDGCARIFNDIVDIGPLEYGSSHPYDLIELINIDRAVAGAPPLAWNEAWSTACTGHSEQVYIGERNGTIVQVDPALVTWYNSDDSQKRQLMDFDGSPATGYFISATAMAFGTHVDSLADFHDALMANFSEYLLDPAVTDFGCGSCGDVWEAMWTYNP